MRGSMGGAGRGEATRLGGGACGARARAAHPSSSSGLSSSTAIVVTVGGAIRIGEGGAAAL
jgi:hypothetical protein